VSEAQSRWACQESGSRALPGPPRYVVTGMAVCDEPEEEMLAAIRGALVDYEVEERPAPMASTQIVVRPQEG
jgi:hypothetical protein